MSAAVIVKALRRERAELALRWLGQFTVTRAADGYPAVRLDEKLILALLDEVIAMTDPAAMAAPARRALHVEALERLAEFPDNVAVTIDLLQAGVQALGAFAVENAGPWAAWSVRERNQFLGELDAVFPLLVRREVAALCERYQPDSSPHAVDPVVEMLGLPDWARTIARRN